MGGGAAQWLAVYLLQPGDAGTHVQVEKEPTLLSCLLTSTSCWTPTHRWYFVLGCKKWNLGSSHKLDQSSNSGLHHQNLHVFEKGSFYVAQDPIFKNIMTRCQNCREELLRQALAQLLIMCSGSCKAFSFIFWFFFTFSLFFHINFIFS